MRRAAIVTLLFAAASLRAGEVMESSYALPDGQRVLRHEVLVAARPEAVWEAWTTSKGLQSFAAPLVAVDLQARTWEASYAPGARLGDPHNIRNEIVSWLPNEMLAIRIVNTPPGFPHPELAKRLFTVIELVRIEDPGTTRVRVSMLPYGTGAEWDRVYDLFRRGNATVLRRLEEKFTPPPSTPPAPR